MDNLNFTGAKFGEQIGVAMTQEHGTQWFGNMPPCLSVITRVRGSDGIFTYLTSFYQDESRPLGWNNTLFPNASMPNPLREMQVLQRPVYGKVDPATGEAPVESLEIARPGTQDRVQFDQTVRDIPAFLEYAGEPAALTRPRLGVWVIMFLAFLSSLSWLLKKVYCRAVKLCLLVTGCPLVAVP